MRTRLQVFCVSFCLSLLPAGIALAQATKATGKVTVASAGADLPLGSVRPTADQAGTDYQLGVGDVIHVFVWREAELTQTAVVRPDGKISLPLAGEIAVAGKTVVETQSLVRDRLLRFVTDPQVTVSVIEIHSRQVYITGQVQRPGAYPLVGSVNVLQLIASAGGLTEYAHRKGIVILDSKDQTRAKFDYGSAVQGKDKSDKLLLAPGDTVVVP
jgi:polysaccharide export outer membrane protein